MPNYEDFKRYRELSQQNQGRTESSQSDPAPQRESLVRKLLKRLKSGRK